MRLGILQCGSVPEELKPEFGDYPEMFRRLLSAVDPSLTYATYDLRAGEHPEHLGECDAWLFTGSKWSVYDDVDWIRRAHDLARALHEWRQPTAGVCFGHQLLAQALGGRVGKSPRGWGVGVHTCGVIDAQRPWMHPAIDTLSLLVSHQDQVEALPERATLIAGHDFCPYGMFQLGEHILAIQGHPEFSRDYARALMEQRRELLGEATYRRGLESLAGATDGPTVARWLLAFLERARA